MADKPKLTPELYRSQMDAYRREQPAYEAYAKTLNRVFYSACKVSFPDALVQSRPKSLSSFAEKMARKFGKYPDAVNQMTDLCGVRVIVQTTEQVKAVRQFIEANFEIVESDDKVLLLGEDEFGYRDMHYIVMLRDDRNDTLGINASEAATIGKRRAEVQVRTWVQHAWADTLHDRIYKNKLTISSDIKRSGSLLAAILEEADHSLDFLADELDGLIANYTAVSTVKEVKQEIEVEELVLDNEPDDRKKPGLALKLARLYAASGDYARVIQLLEPHIGLCNANRCELLMDMGHALCRMHRRQPSSSEYARGRQLLQQALELCEQSTVPFVPHLRKHKSLHARILSRLGWVTEVVPGEQATARSHYHRAHEHEPANPYYLADMLGFEMYCSRSADLPVSMRTTIREGIRICRKHILAGIELPYAAFTAARLSLLLDGTIEKNEPQAAAQEFYPYDALGYCARGIRHYLRGTHCVPADVLDIELEWLGRLNFGKKASAAHKRLIDLLGLGKAIGERIKPSVAKIQLSSPVLIIAGGAASAAPDMVESIRPLIEASLGDFTGTVIAGGTSVGIPGCVGDVAGKLADDKKKRFKLVGYRPEKLPDEAPAHKRYDDSVKMGSEFEPEQILQNWTDILAAGIEPSDVLLLGLGGGDLSAVEYRIAAGLGASVGIVVKSGGAADKLLADALWCTQANIYPLPLDAMTVRAFVQPGKRQIEGPVLEEMAKEFHARYVANNTKDVPANLKPWGKLDDSFKTANTEQAVYAVQILEAAGLGVRPADKPVVFDHSKFTDEEIELMAKLEHGRWNVERLRNGWRYGERNDAKKLHNCLVPWDDLSDGPDGVRKYDRDAVRAFPAILAKAGLEVYRR